MKKAFTLVELLMTVAILLMLAALLLPVAFSVRKRSLEAPCITNLRQLLVAWQSYRMDYDQNWPSHYPELKPYVRDLRIMSCPLDSLNGVNIRDTELLGTRVSYFYLSPTRSDKMWQKLQQIDPNHGVFYCLVHGELRNPTALTNLRNPHTAYSGLVLRAVIDGSIQRKQVMTRCYNDDGVLTESKIVWELWSDVPCPVEFCDGSDRGPEVPCP